MYIWIKESGCLSTKSVESNKDHNSPSPSLPLSLPLPLPLSFFSPFRVSLPLPLPFFFFSHLSLSPFLSLHPSSTSLFLPLPFLRRWCLLERMRHLFLPLIAIFPVQFHLHIPILITFQERGANYQFVRSHEFLMVIRVACARRAEVACYGFSCKAKG